jgi:hypothetical protein
MTALSKIMAAGFDVSLNDTGGLEIFPASKLTQPQREFMKVHKAEIILELNAQNNSVEWIEYTEPTVDDPLKVVCCTPAGKPILILARDQAHKAFLQRMNPTKATSGTCSAEAWQVDVAESVLPVLSVSFQPVEKSVSDTSLKVTLMPAPVAANSLRTK